VFGWECDGYRVLVLLHDWCDYEGAVEEVFGVG